MEGLRALIAVLLGVVILLAVVLGALASYESLPGWARQALSRVGITPPTVTVTVTGVPATVTVTEHYTSTVTVEATVTLARNVTVTVTRTATVVAPARTVTVTVVEAVAGGGAGVAPFLLDPLYRAASLQGLCGGGGVGATVVDGYAVFWKHVGGRVRGWTVLHVEGAGAGEVELVPPGLKPAEGRFVDADYAYVNGSCVVLAFRLSRLLEVLPPGNYTLFTVTGDGYGVECRLQLSRDGLSLGGCRDVRVRVGGSIVLGNYSTFIDALLDSISPGVLARLRSLVYGGAVPADLGEAVWRLLEWVSTRVSYDYAKESRPGAGVYDPLTFARLGRGVCIDYAVFEASVLASLNTTPLILLYPEAEHATAGVSLGGTVFVLDQHPPPMELSDYVEYVDPVDDVVDVYMVVVEGGRALGLVGFRLNTSIVPDLYPEDRLPPWATSKALTIAAKELRVHLDPGLATVIRVGLGTTVSLYQERLSGGRVGVGVFYSPALDNGWARFIADIIVNTTFSSYSDVVGVGSLWATVEDAGNATLVRVYAVPLTSYDVDVRVKNGRLIVYVWYNGSFNPYTDVRLLLYREGSAEPCGGIVAPGYQYRGIIYTTADEWASSPYGVQITVPLDDVERLVASCGGKVYMLIWLKGYPVYAWYPRVWG